jgi:hypothetical protein
MLLAKFADALLTWTMCLACADTNGGLQPLTERTRAGELVGALLDSFPLIMVRLNCKIF